MLQQNINILPLNAPDEEIVPSYNYVCRYLKYGRDFDENIKRQWCIIRKYDVINNTAYDTEMYVVQKDLLLNDILNNDNILNNRGIIQWPSSNGNSNGYSSSPIDYNGVWNLQTYDLYDVFVKDAQGNLINGKAPCDILRIYHPTAKKNLKSIIGVSTVCGTIKVHLLAQMLQNGKDNSTESFDVGNDRYSEYHEFLIPSIDWLTAGGNAWIIEDLSNVDHNPEDLVIQDGNIDYVDLSTLKIPFKTTSEDLEDGSTIFYKVWLPDQQEGLKEDYVSLPIKVIIWPYMGHDEQTSQTIWLQSDEYASGTAVLQDLATVTIAAEFGFDGGHPAIISRITWPKTTGIETLEEAYKYFFGVDLSEYDYAADAVDEEDIDDEDVQPEKMCHFDIKIFSDYHMNEEVWHSFVDLDRPDDFSFQLQGIFNDWKQFPEIVVFQTRFVDRWLGNIIKSNPVMMTQKQLKYLISEWPNSGRISIEGNQQKIEKKENMDLSKVNFIDKVTCIVKKTPQEKQVIPQVAKNTTKVLYKPVFYRTRDLYNLQLHAGVTQNVGVNLVEYMTKVESFIMTIGELKFNEIARNDTFVIFRIDASQIEATDGKYYIADQDGEFISAGQFYVN